MIDEKKLIAYLEKERDYWHHSTAPYSLEVMCMYSDTIDFVNEQPKVGEWIPCSERLPENAKHRGAFCPKYHVKTKYGITEGWHNPDVESWYCLFWFFLGRYDETDIDFKKGDKPKVLRVPDGTGIVIAWKEICEGDENEEQRKI